MNLPFIVAAPSLRSDDALLYIAPPPGREGNELPGSTVIVIGGMRVLRLKGSEVELLSFCRTCSTGLGDAALQAMRAAHSRGKWRIKAGDHTIDFSIPRIMGVVNVTPDSFSDGGLYFSEERAVERALQMEREGADIIDIGGESTRPGSQRVSEEEEMRRVLPVIRRLRSMTSLPISVDTMKERVAEEAVSAGASMINDVKGFSRSGMREIASKYGCGAVIMHMKGMPENMQNNPSYSDVVFEVAHFIHSRLKECADAGMHPESTVLDPGIGFGKTVEHNLLLLKYLGALRSLGRPVLIGASRKGFIGKLTEDAGRRLEGSIAAAVSSYLLGADMLRVHDVAETRKALTVASAIAGSEISVE